MTTYVWLRSACSRLALTALLALAVFLLDAGRASAQDCGGGPLSTSTGNLLGSAVGAVGGGLLGSQFGGGAGKGVMTGLGVVGGALAGGYVGRSAEGCGQAHRQPAAQGAGQAARAGGGPRTCRFVDSQAVIDGQTQQIVGVACLEQDGVWRTASGPAAEQAAGVDLVLRAQQRLHDQGFYVRNNVDGRWGPATSAAVGNFQRANGLASSGQLDAPTQTALGVGPVSLTDLAQGGPPAQGDPAAQAGAPPPAQAVAPPPAATPVAADHSAIYK